MAERARESESNDKDDTSVMSTEFSAVIFNNVSECYSPDSDIECRYTIKSSFKPHSWDWIGLFKVGWQSSREHYSYERSPMQSIQDGGQGRPIANRVVFRRRYLLKADDEFYQFCYVTYTGDVRGASVPFQIKTKPIEQEELKSYEIEDDELELGTSLIMVVKNRTEMSEESLARALEENACLKASNETALADLANANDKVMESESRKADLMAALIESEKKASNLEQMIENLKAKKDESNNLKARCVEVKAECAEKMEKADSEIGRLQEQLVEITEENNILKRNLEEESECHAKKVQGLYIELKKRDQELDQIKEEIAGYRCRIEKVEVESSLNAELLGKRIEELQQGSNIKQEFIHKLEQELEDANTQLEQEKGKITVLTEDSETTIRTLHDQLEGERATKQLLCSQADHIIASLEDQVQEQQKAIMELSQQLERRNAELCVLCGDVDNFKKELQSAEENLQISVAQLTAVQDEVKSLKVEKEILQMTLTDTREASAQSAASMYALQTAYAHMEKKYLHVKKQMEEVWRERGKLKRTIATFHGNVPYDDLRLQMEEIRASNEDFCVRVNMGAEAFKKKFTECRQREEQLYKVTRTSSVQSEETGSALEMENKVSKLQRALEEEKKAQNIDNSLVLQKIDGTYQKNKTAAGPADHHGNANPRDHAHDANRLLLPQLPPRSVLQEHENFPLEMLAFPETWQTWSGNPVQFCTERNADPRLVVYGTRSWYVKSKSNLSQTDQANTKQTSFETKVLWRKVRNPDLQSCSPQAQGGRTLTLRRVKDGQ